MNHSWYDLLINDYCISHLLSIGIVAMVGQDVYLPCVTDLEIYSKHITSKSLFEWFDPSHNKLKYHITS